MCTVKVLYSVFRFSLIDTTITHVNFDLSCHDDTNRKASQISERKVSFSLPVSLFCMCSSSHHTCVCTYSHAWCGHSSTQVVETFRWHYHLLRGSVSLFPFLSHTPQNPPPLLTFDCYNTDNAGVIVNNKGEMKGSGIAGPVAKECSEIWPRIAANASAVV